MKVMTSTADPGRTAHPVLAAVIAAEVDVQAVRDVDALYMSPADQAAALLKLTALTSEIVELRSRILLAAERSGQLVAATCSSDVAGWLAHETRCGGAQAREATRFAEALERRSHVADALRAGTMTWEQAPVICRALDQLPSDVDAAVAEKAELHLVELADRFDPRQLRVLGRGVLDAVAPELAEEHEARALEREEREARRHCRLSFYACGDGTTRLHGILPDVVATRLANYLHAFTSPRHRKGEKADFASRPVEGDTVDATDGQAWFKLPGPQRRGEAFCELIESIDPQKLPDHGTVATHLIVMMTLEALRADLGAATVLGPSGAERISAAEARRMACGAGIIPAVLGGTSEVLDLGREQRLASKAQKRALMLAHQTCQAVGCDRPAAWTEVHHLDPWSHGGVSDLENLVLLCGRDHHRIHDSQMDHTRHSDGSIRFHRRP